MIFDYSVIIDYYYGVMIFDFSVIIYYDDIIDFVIVYVEFMYYIYA